MMFLSGPASQTGILGCFFAYTWFWKQRQKRVNTLKTVCLLALLPSVYYMRYATWYFPILCWVLLFLQHRRSLKIKIVLRERISWSELREGWW